MTYREIRDHKFKILFMYYFLHTTIDEVFLNYFGGMPYDDEDENSYINGNSFTHQNVNKIKIQENIGKEKNVSDAAVEIKLADDDYVRDIKMKVTQIIEKTAEIDDMIKTSLASWDINRVGKAELTIIRLAIFEMYYDVSVDLPVAINEAVELAKVYCDDKADKFVNGVLATIYKMKGENIKAEK